MRIIEARLLHGTKVIAVTSGDTVRRALSQLADDPQMRGLAAAEVPHQLTIQFATREWSEAGEE